MTQDIIFHTAGWVKKRLAQAEGGHDWWHIHRVWQVARHIGLQEGADLMVVELAALLHDIADAKFYAGDETIGPRIAREYLQTHEVHPEVVNHVILIMENMSFKQEFQGRQFESLELKVVQDADRLDAIGAIGIARAFNFGGFKQRPLYDPDILPNLIQTKEEYKQSRAPTINHFYEKLLLLKDKMLTPTGKILAEERHQFLELFLQQFFKEWGDSDKF